MYKSLKSALLKGAFVFFLAVGLVATLGPSETYGQGMSAPSAKNAAYVELAGNGLFYTINYDRRFGDKYSGRLGLMRAGAGDVSITAIPLVGNYLVGSGNHRFELGVGPQIFLVSISIPSSGTADGFAGFDEDATAIAGTATIGYRYQPTDGGFVFRIGLTPSFSQFGFLPWAGLSLGYAF